MYIYIYIIHVNSRLHILRKRSCQIPIRDPQGDLIHRWSIRSEVHWNLQTRRFWCYSEGLAFGALGAVGGIFFNMYVWYFWLSKKNIGWNSCGVDPWNFSFQRGNVSITLRRTVSNCFSTPQKINSLNLKMMVWKMFLLFQGCILRFHVNLPGCKKSETANLFSLDMGGPLSFPRNCHSLLQKKSWNALVPGSNLASGRCTGALV